MTDTLTLAICDALEYLRGLGRDGVRPEEAQTRIQNLRAQHPATRIDLLWEEEACDRSLHYDTLVHCDGEGTVSLSLCPERTLPWPLRGVQRWSEMDLVRVNTVVLKVDQAVALLDFIWDEAPILNRLVQAGLMQEALEREPISVSDEELQRTLDAFRRAHRLYRAEDMHGWMERRGLTHEKLEHHIAELAEVGQLRQRVAAGRVDNYFLAHETDFATVSLAQFAVADAGLAGKIADQVRSGELDFYAAAELCFLSGDGAAGDLFTTVRRGQAAPELSDAFTAEPGTVLGPIRQGDKHIIVRVLSGSPARLDDSTRAAIEQLLFEEWLESRRREATIEWYWGPTVPTAGME